MQLILDADALIKLNRAGVLGQVARGFECVVPSSVFEEVVSNGRALGYADADDIETHLKDQAEIVPVEASSRDDSVLGAGELGILEILGRVEDLIVVSDDRRFLLVLGLEGFRFLTTGAVLVLLHNHHLITQVEAMTALGRLRSAISESAYSLARTALESTGE